MQQKALRKKAFDKLLAANSARLAEVQERCLDVSWFIRAMAEPIAQMSKMHEQCTGRF